MDPLHAHVHVVLPRAEPDIPEDNIVQERSAVLLGGDSTG